MSSFVLLDPKIFYFLCLSITSYQLLKKFFVKKQLEIVKFILTLPIKFIFWYKCDFQNIYSWTSIRAASVKFESTDSFNWTTYYWTSNDIIAGNSRKRFTNEFSGNIFIKNIFFHYGTAFLRESVSFILGKTIAMESPNNRRSGMAANPKNGHDFVDKKEALHKQ